MTSTHTKLPSRKIHVKVLYVGSVKPQRVLDLRYTSQHFFVVGGIGDIGGHEKRRKITIELINEDNEVGCFN